MSLRKNLSMDPLFSPSVALDDEPSAARHEYSLSFSRMHIVRGRLSACACTSARRCVSRPKEQTKMHVTGSISRLIFFCHVDHLPTYLPR